MSENISFVLVLDNIIVLNGNELCHLLMVMQSLYCR